MDDRENLQIEPLSSNVLANLTVEELEQRLELQMIQVTPGGLCFLDYCDINTCVVNTCACDGINCQVAGS